MRELIERIEAATPHHRDRAVDALRALAILGVVLGHWLVTAMVVDSGSVHAASPLQRTPELAPVSWVFQTLAVFFLVGGQVAAKSYESSRARGVTYGRWLGARIARLFRPVAALLVVWTVTAGTMFVSGVGYDNLHALLKLVLSPLWFLLVFAGLTALTPLVARLHPLWPVVVVIHVDIIRLGLDGPARLGWINVAAGWLVPYCLGAAWARGELRSRTTGWTLLIGGATATALLVLLAGYPASMVGVPGAGISNLDPPTLAAVTFGLAQCGAALLLSGPLRRILVKPAAWAAVALVNLSAMTVFLWHQTAMLAVTATGLLTGRTLPGLHTRPDGTQWIIARLLWLPVFAVALTACWAAFRTYEQRRQGRTTVVREGRPSSACETHRA
ncbi:acyltransferase family protein [Streptomyces sp. DT20]|uniref:acyltransferase family protein n=1 Tax=unclassified Streptomyces TaxID=2593676 RepID=UPI000939354E|nr:acyltransferase [Streptomyces sp. CB02488]OKK23161.1 acyltransferase [Streptomyces sp. CB02488]